MIMSFDIVVEKVDMFGSVNLIFELYGIKDKTLIHNHLIVPKMFLKTV